MSILSRYWLTGRREAVRRQGDRQKAYRIDRHSLKTLGASLLFVTLSTLYVVLISFLLFLPCTDAIAREDTSIGGLPYSKIGIINNSPDFQLEVAVDGRDPFIIDRGKSGSFLLNGMGIIGEHKLVAKAYLPPSKEFRRRQIGRESITIFHITGDVKTSPIGKVGWYHIFTSADFFPQLFGFPTERYRQIRAKSSGITYRGKLPTRRREKRKKDRVYGLILGASEEYRIPMALLTAVIEVESAFNTHAVSRKGALGLMQLMPETCARFGIQRPFDPQQNIEGGAKYLSYLLHQWSLKFPPYRRLELSLAAYNAGEQRVELYSEVPPFKETRDYVRKVLRRYKSFPQIERSVH
jgi:hypothetical protein